jgi:hypothetical protein
VLIFLLAACSGPQPPKRAAYHIAAMAQTDSVQVMYFRSTDSIRFFTYTTVANKAFTGQLAADLLQDTASAKPICKKEGKMYCFAKGQVINTVYFGYTDTCRFLSYIKGGTLYHFAISTSLQKQLQQYRSQAREPIADGGIGTGN